MTTVRQYRQAPQYLQPLQSGANTTAAWYRFFQDQNLGKPPGSESVITLTGSPFVYIAPQGGFVIIEGGSVSEIQFTRIGSYNTGQTQGAFPISQGDSLTITYSSAPAVTFVPT